MSIRLDPGVRRGDDQICIAAVRLWIARSTDSAASVEVFGLSAIGVPVTSMCRLPKAPAASIACTLPGASGSAMSVTSVRSNPSPASASVAATLAFCGNSFAASPTAHFETEEMIAASDRCVVCWRYSWRSPDGSSASVRGVDVLRVRDGLVAEKRSYVKG